MQHFLLFWLFYHVEHTPEKINTRGLSLTLGMIKQRVILILISICQLKFIIVTNKIQNVLLKKCLQFYFQPNAMLYCQ